MLLHVDVNIDLVFCRTGFCVLLLKPKMSCLKLRIHLTFRRTRTAVGGEEGKPANNQLNSCPV